jgi:hypothetical protein
LEQIFDSLSGNRENLEKNEIELLIETFGFLLSNYSSNVNFNNFKKEIAQEY